MVSRRRKVLVAIAAGGVIVLGVAALRILPSLTGPALPPGAIRLHIATERPNLSFGCASALLAPTRVATSGDELILVFVESGSTVRVVWPSGFAAWRVADVPYSQIRGAASSVGMVTCWTASGVGQLRTTPSTSVPTGS